MLRGSAATFGHEEKGRRMNMPTQGAEAHITLDGES